MRHLKRTWVRVVLLAGAALAVGATAYASIPDSGGVIHGCYLSGIGALRLVFNASGQMMMTQVSGFSGSPARAGPANAASCPRLGALAATAVRRRRSPRT